MSFIEEIKERAKKDIKTIVLPEAEDVRTLEATKMVLEEKYAKVILIGNKEKVLEKAKENNIDITGVEIINPVESEKYDEYVNLLYDLRKHKGMTIEQAKELVKDPTYYGMLMLKDEGSEADGLVSGAVHSTSDTLRPALQILKTAPGTKLVSAFFVMVVPNCDYGENGTAVSEEEYMEQCCNYTCTIVDDKYYFDSKGQSVTYDEMMEDCSTTEVVVEPEVPTDNGLVENPQTGFNYGYIMLPIGIVSIIVIVKVARKNTKIYKI